MLTNTTHRVPHDGLRCEWRKAYSVRKARAKFVRVFHRYTFCFDFRAGSVFQMLSSIIFACISEISIIGRLLSNCQLRNVGAAVFVGVYSWILQHELQFLSVGSGSLRKTGLGCKVIQECSRHIMTRSGVNKTLLDAWTSAFRYILMF